MPTWSGIRNKLENDYLCPALRGRIQYFATSYWESHDQTGRAAIRLDGVEVLRSNYFIMTLWYGTHREKFYEGLRFVYYTEQEIRKLIPDGLKIEAIERYTEIEQDDSLLVILKGGSET